MRPTIFGGPGLYPRQYDPLALDERRKAGDHQFDRYRRKRSRG